MPFSTSLFLLVLPIGVSLLKICAQCSISFLDEATRRPRKYCSNKCKYKSKYTRNRELGKVYALVHTKYRRHKGGFCVRCGFIPEDTCQLDVDHIDGNHNNNSTDNLQTLCANCHRLKTKRNKDGIYK